MVFWEHVITHFVITLSDPRTQVRCLAAQSCRADRDHTLRDRTIRPACAGPVPCSSVVSSRFVDVQPLCCLPPIGVAWIPLPSLLAQSAAVALPEMTSAALLDDHRPPGHPHTPSAIEITLLDSRLGPSCSVAVEPCVNASSN